MIKNVFVILFKRLISFILTPVEMIFPRFKAAGLIGAASRAKSIFEAKEYFERVVVMAARSKRPLTDELLLLTAYLELFDIYCELEQYSDAVKYGIKAMRLLLGSHEFGWEFYEKIGSSKKATMIHLRKIIEIEKGGGYLDDIKDLDALIAKMGKGVSQKQSL